MMTRAAQTSIRPAKRRKPVAAIEEVSFDPIARREYLTGFHKRKQQRLKVAQDRAVRREKEDRIRRRRQIREDRDAAIRANVEASRSLTAANAIADDASSVAESRDEQGDGTAEAAASSLRTALGTAFYEDDNVDESLQASVSIEVIEPTRAGIRGMAEGTQVDGQEGFQLAVEDTGRDSAPSEKKPRKVWSARAPHSAEGASKKLKKSRKVRYLCSEERAAERHKQHRSQGRKKSSTKRKRQ